MEAIIFLFLAAGYIGALFGINSHLKQEDRDYIYKVIQPGNFKNTNELIKAINGIFIRLFDSVYHYSDNHIYRNIYRSVIFCCVWFLIMKCTTFLFDMKMPETKYILLVIIFISAYAVLYYISFTKVIPKILELHEKRERRLQLLLPLIKSLSFNLYAISFAIFTLVVMIFSFHFGITIKTCIIFFICTFFIIVLTITIVSLPTNFFKVSPKRSFFSSIIFLTIIVFLYLFFHQWNYIDLRPNADESFSSILGLIVPFIVFNILGDLISYNETRLILGLSQKLKPIWLLGLLPLDFIFSAGIFLILPMSSNVSFETLFLNLWFKGETPWIGILFWTSFATSLIYYLFAISTFFANLFYPLFLKILKVYSKVIEWKFVRNYPFVFVGIILLIIVAISSFFIYIKRTWI